MVFRQMGPKEIHVVILSIKDDEPTGVERYMRMLRQGLAKCDSRIVLHLLHLDKRILFPEIKEENGVCHCYIPFPLMSDMLHRDFWKLRYFEVVAGLVVPYLQNYENIIWHVQELYLCEFAEVLKKHMGGIILTHLHSLPWKFNIENNERLFNKMYSEYLTKSYDLITGGGWEKRCYQLSDRIICVSQSAKDFLVQVYCINPDKIAVIYNGLE